MTPSSTRHRLGSLPQALLLALIAGLLLWHMATLSLWDPSEARYATLAANMAATGDFVRPAFYHHDLYQTFAGKPPLAFQLGGFACRWLGQSAFAVRLPSFLSMLGVLLLLRRVSRKRLAPLLCLSMIGFIPFAGVCMTDPPLLLTTFGLLSAGYTTLRRPCLATALAAGAFAAAGFLVKGPVALVLGGLPLLLWYLLNRRELPIPRLGHLLAAALLFLALALPWFILIEAREPGSLRYFFLNENLGRFLTQSYGDRYGSGHKTFFGISCCWWLLLTCPWCLVLLRRRAWRHLHRNFPAIATLAMVGFWCLTPRVPLAYLLPALPTTAWWIARRPIQAVRFWPIVAALITLAVVTLGQTFARLNPHKFPRAFYASLPEEATLSFQGSAPYSAEFYLGSRVRRNGTGDLLIRREGRHYIARPNTPAKAPGKASSEGTTGTPAAESRSGV